MVCDYCFVICQAQMPDVCWFKPLKCDDLLRFCFTTLENENLLVLDYKLKMSPLAISNCDGHLTVIERILNIENMTDR